MHIKTSTSSSTGRRISTHSSQPEFFLFLSSFRDQWVEAKELNDNFIIKEISLPFSLGNVVFKFETNGLEGEIVSFAIAFNEELHVVQLCSPDGLIEFYRHCVDKITILATSEAPLFYSYDMRFIRKALDRLKEVSETPAVRDLRVNCRDLSKKERKALFVRNLPDIDSSEVPQYWSTNSRLCDLLSNRTPSKEIQQIRCTILDSLAKHVALECTRISMIYLRDLINNFDQLSSPTRTPREKQYEFFADSMRDLGDYQSAAFWYSKLLASDIGENMEYYMSQLEFCISEMRPEELIRYAVYAAQAAKGKSPSP